MFTKALITGGNSGIGFATAKKFLELGIQVLVIDREITNLQNLQKDAESLVFLKADLTNDDDLKQVENFISTKGDNLDILINNAGYSIRGMVEEVPITRTEHLFKVNVFSAIQIMQYCLPFMRKQRKGIVINVSSIAGKFTFPGNANYAATKHALEAYTDALRHEVAPFGIHVVSLRPAFINSNFNATALTLSEGISSDVAKEYNEIAKASSESLKRLWQKLTPISPDDVADLMVEIIKSKKPKAAYSIGPLAEEFLTKKAQLNDDDYNQYMNDLTGLTDLKF